MSDDRSYNSGNMNECGIADKNNTDVNKESLAGLSSDEEKVFIIDLNRNNIINGVILSELLGPPKSKRKRERPGSRRQRTV